MPEGPEVRTTTDFLTNYAGKTLTGFATLSGRYLKKGEIPGENCFSLPAIVKSVDCKGKFIYFTLSDANKEYYLFSTLGMTGMWTNIKTKHSRFLMFFDDESILYYNDIRNFGTLKFVDDQGVLDKKLKSLGPDVLDHNVTWCDIRKACLRKPNKTIAECLMNQSVISGVGNYLKAEILYESRISPHRLSKDISDQEWTSLGTSTLVTARLSYSLGGATIESYRQPNGTEGLYNRRFAVYNQEMDLYGNTVIREHTADKRTTHWVPNIQK